MTPLEELDGALFDLRRALDRKRILDVVKYARVLVGVLDKPTWRRILSSYESERYPSELKSQMR